MKISAIGFYNLNQKKLSNQRVEKYQTADFATTSNAIKHSGLLINPMFYPLAFGAKGDLVSPNKLFSLKFQTMCPCCGRSMVTPNHFRAKLTEEALTGSSENAVKVLSGFEKNMYEIEKLCFKKIKELSLIEPDKTLQELLIKMRAPSRKQLNANQYSTLNKIDILGEGLPDESKTKLTQLTNEARYLISADIYTRPFKRKAFIKKIEDIKNEIPENNIGQELYKEAINLDNSDNNMHAFIVKYSRRGSKEIGQRLVSKSVATAEHIIPQAKGGRNLLENYISECAGCNNTRGETNLNEWIVNSHPEMTTNIQKHIDLIIDKINSGRYKEFAWYPQEVSKTIYEQSKGLITLDTSRLNINSATSPVG